MTCYFHPFSDEMTMGEQNIESAHKRLYQVHPQGQNKNRLSARLYEYFVNNFSQRIVCIQGEVNLGTDYKEKCELYQKKNFTYFRRGEAVAYSIDLATVGTMASKNDATDTRITLRITDPLLRFLDWVATRKVDVFILNHIDVILKQKATSFPTLSYIENELCSSISGMTLYPTSTLNAASLPCGMNARSRTKKLKQLGSTSRWYLPPNNNNVFEIRIGQ